MKKFKVFSSADIMKMFETGTVHTLEEKPNGGFGYTIDPSCKLEELTEGKYAPHRVGGKKIIVIECPTGFVVCDNEACGEIITGHKKASFEISETTTNEDGSKSISIFPVAEVRFDVKELLEKATPMEESTLNDHVRRFGGRIESNFRAIVNAAVELGADKDDLIRLDK